MALVASVLFTCIMFLSVLPYSLVIIAVRVFGYWASYAAVLVWIRGTMGLLKLMCGLGYKVEGRENMPDAPSIAMLKHSSAYETLIQLLIFPRQTWVLKRELMWAPFLGWAIATLRPIAIDRSGGHSAVDQVLKQGRARLESGLWIMVFPEGTRMPPGESRRYGLSGALLATQTGRLIVPVAHNAGDFWPRRGWRKKRGTVSFAIGPPIDPAGRQPREVNAEVQKWIEAKVAELRGRA